MFIVENNDKEFEICYTQGKIIEDIQRLLNCHNKIETLDGDQVFFTIKYGESEFKISIEKNKSL
jgi:hypothetical protein